MKTYSAPGFIKVSLDIKENFAAYSCPMDQFGNWTYTVPCEGTDDYVFVGDTFVGLEWGSGCYTKQSAPAV